MVTLPLLSINSQSMVSVPENENGNTKSGDKVPSTIPSQPSVAVGMVNSEISEIWHPVKDKSGNVALLGVGPALSVMVTSC